MKTDRPGFDAYVLNGQPFSDLDALLVSRQELIRALIRENGWAPEERSGRVLVLDYDADTLFPLEQKTTVPTAALSRFFEMNELHMLARPRRIWENDPAIPPGLHERLLAILIHTHLMPETLDQEDADDLNDAFDESAELFLDVLQQMQMRHDTHPSNEVPLYQKENRYLAVCPPFERDEADLSIRIQPSDEVDVNLEEIPGDTAELFDAAWETLGNPDVDQPDVNHPDVTSPDVDEQDEDGFDDTRSGSTFSGDDSSQRDLSSQENLSEKTGLSGYQDPSATEDNSEKKASSNRDTDRTTDSREAIVLALQLAALLAGLAAMAYAAIALL